MEKCDLLAVVQEADREHKRIRRAVVLADKLEAKVLMLGTTTDMASMAQIIEQYNALDLAYALLTGKRYEPLKRER